MVDFFKIKFMQTVIQKTAPISFHDIWQSNQEKRLMDNPGYDSSLRDDNDDLFVPFAWSVKDFPLLIYQNYGTPCPRTYQLFGTL